MRANPVGRHDPGARSHPIDMNEFNNVVDGSAIDGRTGNFCSRSAVSRAASPHYRISSIHRLHVDENIHFDRTSMTARRPAKRTSTRGCTTSLRATFRSRTRQGVLREFNVRFGQRGRPNLDFSFIEIAGEDIRSIVPTAGQTHPKLNDHLERYLRQGGVNKRFVFISDASRNRLGSGTIRRGRVVRHV